MERLSSYRCHPAGFSGVSTPPSTVEEEGGGGGGLWIVRPHDFFICSDIFMGCKCCVSADQIRLESLSGGWMNDLYRWWNIKNITIINLFGILFVSQFCFWCRVNGNFDFSPKLYWLIGEGNHWMRDELPQRFLALLSPSSCLISLWITSSLNAL